MPEKKIPGHFNCTKYVLLLNFKNIFSYSHPSNSRGGRNKQGGGAKVVKSINVEGGINMDRVQKLLSP